MKSGPIGAGSSRGSLVDDALRRYLTPEEAASLLRTTRKAIYIKVARRQLPGVVRIGRRLLIRTSSLLEWLDQQSASSLQE